MSTADLSMRRMTGIFALVSVALWLAIANFPPLLRFLVVGALLVRR